MAEALPPSKTIITERMSAAAAAAAVSRVFGRRSADSGLLLLTLAWWKGESVPSCFCVVDAAAAALPQAAATVF